MRKKETKKCLPFGSITTSSELISYLDDCTARLRDRRYLYHYTTLSKLTEMLRGENCYWHLSNAKNMNDMIEYNNGDPVRWKNLFFASFMSETKESIGMWGVYSQPWEIGVKIALPIADVKKWIKEISEAYEVSKTTYDTYKLTGNKVTIKDGLKVWLSAVAYSNCLSHEDNEIEEKLSWSTQSNIIFSGATRIPELTGYIKDEAWDYEREIRLKAEFKNDMGFERIAILIPPALINKMIISPLFKGSLTTEITREVHRQLQTDKSMFTGKLYIKSPCSDCSYKNNPKY